MTSPAQVALQHPAGAKRLTPDEGQKLAQLAAPGSYLAMAIRHCMALQADFDSLSRRAELMREALRKLVEIADTQPFTAIGHVVEHVVPEARAALREHV